MINTIETAFSAIACISRGIELAYAKEEEQQNETITIKCSICQTIPFISKILLTPELSIYQRLAGYSFSFLSIIAKNSTNKELKNRVSVPIDIANIIFSSTLAYKIFYLDAHTITNIALTGFNFGCAIDGLITIRNHLYS